jgi:hypothetical protein
VQPETLGAWLGLGMWAFFIVLAAYHGLKGALMHN